MRIDRQVREAVDRLELPFNSMGIDPYGISKADLRVWCMAVGAFYRWYFSVRTRGIEHVPARGRAMLVGNHSGGIAIDAARTTHLSTSAWSSSSSWVAARPVRARSTT